LRSLITVAALFAIYSCNGPTNSWTKENQADVAAEVRKTLYNYHSDIRKSGLTAEFKYLDTSKDFFWVPPGFPNAIFYDSVATIINRNSHLFKSVDNKWDTLTVIPLSNKYATYTGHMLSIMTDTSGQVSEFKLTETGVLVKRNDGWKLLSGQTSVL